MGSAEHVAIFWDFENCHPASNVSGHLVAANILKIARTEGIVTTFKAYLEIPQQSSGRGAILRSELQCSGVSLTDTPHNGSKDVADKMMLGRASPLVDMLAFAIDNPPPATIILISGDRDFAYAASILRMRLYKVILIIPNDEVHISLKCQASSIFEWKAHILGGSEVDTSTSLSAVESAGVNALHRKSVSWGGTMEGNLYDDSPSTPSPALKPKSEFPATASGDPNTHKDSPASVGPLKETGDDPSGVPAHVFSLLERRVASSPGGADPKLGEALPARESDAITPRDSLPSLPLFPTLRPASEHRVHTPTMPSPATHGIPHTRAPTSQGIIRVPSSAPPVLNIPQPGGKDPSAYTPDSNATATLRPEHTWQPPTRSPLTSFAAVATSGMNLPGLGPANAASSPSPSTSSPSSAEFNPKPNRVYLRPSTATPSVPIYPQPPHLHSILVTLASSLAAFKVKGIQWVVRSQLEDKIMRPNNVVLRAAGIPSWERLAAAAEKAEIVYLAEGCNRMSLRPDWQLALDRLARASDTATSVQTMDEVSRVITQVTQDPQSSTATSAPTATVDRIADNRFPTHSRSPPIHRNGIASGLSLDRDSSLPSNVDGRLSPVNSTAISPTAETRDGSKGTSQDEKSVPPLGLENTRDLLLALEAPGSNLMDESEPSTPSSSPGLVMELVLDVPQSNAGNSANSPSTSVSKVVPAKYQPMVRCLMGLRRAGFMKPTRSMAGVHIRKENRNLLRSMTWKEYAAQAEKAGIIKLGGVHAQAWVALHEDWVQDATRSKPP
ncbi:hypothetical protein PLICRDRAFT_333488 [Plicaturopsis crispa FD-325 SS-3]|uniref:NYN domain-containing protein n=1 Tax=Plicaturopsis crispa FD-325 SS-3 TaxID=944288 RepID=A0A0C9T756_PLICR|nr:hypothetical protein PLICRDRAFT_333488 [Plicaturopsis crispa FD-325 SS-3]